MTLKKRSLPPLDIGQVLRRAAGAGKTGQFEIAARHYGSVLARYPANRRALAGLMRLGPALTRQIVDTAQRLEARGHFDQAEPIWISASALRPESIGIAIGLARCRQRLGLLHAALDAIERILALHPHAPEALDARGCILRDLGRFDDAERCLQAALRGTAGDAAPLNHLGTLAQARGKTGDARSFFRRAVDCVPTAPELHANLAAVTDYAPDHPHIAEMEALLAKADASDTAMAPLHFALFRAHDATGRTGAAFDHLRRGNEMRKAEIGYDVNVDAARFARWKTMLPQTLPATGGRAWGPRPIFIVGLPRSGTTLVEQILGRCPGVQPAGELSVVSDAVGPLLEALEDRADFEVRPGDLAALRERLQDGLARYSDGAPVIVDKMPLNFRWSGLICAALPEARVVRIHRAPVAVAWSIYRHSFSGPGNGFAYDMGDIAAYLTLYKDLMATWTNRFPDSIQTLDYAELTRGPEPVLRALVARCGLEWSDDCLRPHDSARPVLTASAAQVRQPIHVGADDAWQRYADHLAPLVRALRDTGAVAESHT